MIHKKTFERQFKGVILPELKISDIKWSAVKIMSLDQMEAQFKNLNLDQFRLTLKESSIKSCEKLFFTIIMEFDLQI